MSDTVVQAPPAGIAQGPFVELRTYCAEVGEPLEADAFVGIDAKVAREWASFMEAGRTPEDFYRESHTYLSHLTAFGEDIWKEPYHDLIVETLPPPRRILDFGCGIGADGLKLAARGYNVAFADYSTRCTDYLKWRIAQRGWENPVYDWTAVGVPEHFDLVFAFDVVEHAPDAAALLRQIEGYADYVAVNLLKVEDTGAVGPQLHYPMDVDALMDGIEERGTVLTGRDLGYSMFVIYRVGKP